MHARQLFDIALDFETQEDVEGFSRRESRGSGEGVNMYGGRIVRRVGKSVPYALFSVG